MVSQFQTSRIIIKIIASNLLNDKFKLKKFESKLQSSKSRKKYLDTNLRLLV